jgi:hypothetical protein
LHFPSIEDLASAVAVISFAGGIILYLFKKIVTDPLRGSMSELNTSILEINRMLESLKAETNNRMDKLEGRLGILEEHDVRHEERIKTLYKERG